MKAYHALEWIDHLISIELAPAVSVTESFTPEMAGQIKERIETEEKILLSRLKQQIFKLDEEQSQGLIRKYHDSLILIMAKNYDHQQDSRNQMASLKELHEYIGRRLEHTLKLFEREFSAFLSDENRMPVTRLLPLKALISEKRALMEEKLSGGAHGSDPVNIVMEVMDDFTGRIDQRLPITIREASYIKELITDVLALKDQGSALTTCQPLNELLIYWNLNSKSCIRYFTLGVEALLLDFETTEQKVEFLHLEYKKLQAIPEKQNFTLNPEFPSVKAYCTEWLNNEISYRERRLEGFIPLAQEQAAMTMKENSAKVVIAASVDQVGLLLRAADDLEILKGKSKSAIFKAIFPYISTPGAVNPNWNRSRTASYTAEESDKVAAKRLLHSMAEKIDDY